MAEINADTARRTLWRRGMLPLLILIAAGIALYVRASILKTDASLDVATGVRMRGDEIASVEPERIRLISLNGNSVLSIPTAAPSEVVFSSDAQGLAWISEQLRTANAPRFSVRWFDMSTETQVPLYWSDRPVQQIRLSAQGTHVSFLEDETLFILERSTQRTTRIAEEVRTYAWAPATRALVVQSALGTQYIPLNLRGEPAASVSLEHESETLHGIAFVDGMSLASIIVQNEIPTYTHINLSSGKRTLSIPWGYAAQSSERRIARNTNATAALVIDATETGEQIVLCTFATQLCQEMHGSAQSQFLRWESPTRYLFGRSRQSNTSPMSPRAVDIFLYDTIQQEETALLSEVISPIAL